jgi:hypothetical protein
MADFSAQSASLSAPSGAGDSPVVTQRTPVPASTLPQALSGIADMLGKGVDNYYNVQMIKARNGILGQIGQQQSAINAAVASGQMDQQEAHVRSMAIYNKSLAAYPQLASDIQGLNAAFKATTQTGDTDNLVKQKQDEAQKIRDQQTQMAISQGYHLSPDMSEAQRGVIVTAAETNTTAQRVLAQQQAQFNFQKDQNVYSQEQANLKMKETSIGLIADMAGKNMDAFDATVQNLSDQVRANKMTPDQARATLQSQFGNISGVIQSLAGKNPELAAPYRSLFESKYQLGLQRLDPTKASDETKSQYDKTITQAKIDALTNDPKLKTLVATSQMLNTNNSLLMATNAEATMKAMAMAGKTPTQNGLPGTYVPQIAGNPEVEADALKALKSGIDTLRGGKVADGMAGNAEGSNAVNNLLSQTGNLLNQGATPDKLKGLADFFSSSQYAYMVQHGQIDATAEQAAKKTFQMIYTPAVTNAVGTKLQGTLPNSQTNIADAVDVNFTGAGVQFTPKKGLNADDAKQAGVSVDGLKTAAQGLNTVVRMGAHMEGTTDYQKYWDDNKYYILPQAFPVKPGQVVNGFKWSGTGDYRDKSTWKKVGGNG